MAVIGTPDEKWGEAVTAVVVHKEDGVSPEEMISFCEGEISGYKKPKRVEFEDEIPRNPSGKILKNVLRERYGAAGSRTPLWSAPALATGASLPVRTVRVRTSYRTRGTSTGTAFCTPL